MADDEPTPTPAEVCAAEGHQPHVAVYDYSFDPPKLVGKQCPRCGATQ